MEAPAHPNMNWIKTTQDVCTKPHQWTLNHRRKACANAYDPFSIWDTYGLWSAKKKPHQSKTKEFWKLQHILAWTLTKATKVVVQNLSDEMWIAKEMPLKCIGQKLLVSTNRSKWKNQSNFTTWRTLSLCIAVLALSLPQKWFLRWIRSSTSNGLYLINWTLMF